jgi:3-oxoacyl-[acyl-carrier protein] reductase
MALLKDKIAIITGAGTGIGRGIAHGFIRQGATVIIAERNATTGAKVERELVEDLGGKAVFIQTDVGDKAQCEALVRTATIRFGGVDILVNNAFSLSPNVLLEQKTDAMLEQTFGAGLWANWWLMQACRETMTARGGGAVINFYSIDADVAAWLHADYNITKSAILGLTRSAAAEWGRFNIRVNAIAPAAMGDTFHKLAAENPGFSEAAAARKPLCRNGDPEADIAPVVVFLASEMSRYVTGELINVDGGLHLPGYASKPADLSVFKA